MISLASAVAAYTSVIISPSMSRGSKRHPELLVSPAVCSLCRVRVPRLTPCQCCNFNQDFSCIAVGHRKGYTILNCDPFGKVHSKSESRLGAERHHVPRIAIRIVLADPLAAC